MLDARDAGTSARAARLGTRHGEVMLPAFFPVATQGVVKTLTSEQVRGLGVGQLLANAFHLHLRPGEEAIQSLGGLHRFMGWDGPLLTDSGGFQVFSLADLRTVTDEGVRFASPADGSVHFFTPEKVVEIQRRLGADMIVALDECVAYPSPRGLVEEAAGRTLRWAKASLAQWRALENEHPGQILFGVVQGGTIKEVRLKCVERLAELRLPGYAVGGVSVGEGPELAREVLSYTLEGLPADRPRYVMGYGSPEDLLEAIALGADMFDCVLPTRNARTGTAFSRLGKVRLRNAAHAASRAPIEEGCGCPCCSNYSRGYLRHLFQAGEATGPALVTMHNLWFYTRLMASAREAILAGSFGSFRRDFTAAYTSMEGS